VGPCRRGRYTGTRRPRSGSRDVVDQPPRSLPASRQAPSEARRHVSEVCAGWPASQLRVAQLLTTEIVTNAVVHGSGEVVLRVAGGDHVLRVEVSDDGPGLPGPVSPTSPRQRGGRGLRILAAMATVWGVEPRDDGAGKTVWFELRRAVA
jgi:serine/threonine-protein kinase RsbW